MPWTLYRSTDASAPTLTGTVGSLVALLDAILVNGYGSQPAAGWSKAFTGTNKAAYRNGAAARARHYLRVDDSGAGGGGAKEAQVRAYEAMTDVDTGTDPYPNLAQVSGSGLYVRKSNTADATARVWVAVADDRTFILYIYTGDTASIALGLYFGEFISFNPADSFQSILIARTTANQGGYNGEWVGAHAGFTTLAGHYIARTISGVTKAIAAGKMTSVFTAANYGIGGNLSFPNPCDGGLYVSRYFLVAGAEVGNHVRGYLRGLWMPLHPAGTFQENFIITGTGELAGKTFYIVSTLTSQNSGGGGPVALEISNTVGAS